MSFRCVIVTPDQQLLDETVKQAIVPAHDGQLGILTDRAPLLAKLGLGALTIDLAAGGRRVFFVDGGVAQMKDNVLTLVTSDAIAAEQLSAEAAQAELAKATADRANASVPADLREKSVRRAQVKVDLAKK